jgi:small-conductance mechanosensitive channel
MSMMLQESLANSEEHGCTPSERASSRRYFVEIGVAALAYVALTFMSVSSVDHIGGAGKVGVALLPMLGVVAMSVAMVRFAARMDELQRQTFIVSGAIAGLACAIVTMALGFLENAGVPRLSMTWVWPMTAIAFAISFPFVRRRYR